MERTFADEVIVPVSHEDSMICAGCGSGLVHRYQRSPFDDDPKPAYEKRHTVLDCLRALRERIESHNHYEQGQGR